MKKIYIFLILIASSFFATAATYEKSNSILNIKYGFKIGDLIEVEDKIITNTKFIKVPELTIKKNKGLKLISQTNNISMEADKYIFLNKIIYQIYQKSESRSFTLPTHKYKINNENTVMPKKNYWAHKSNKKYFGHQSNFADKFLDKTVKIIRRKYFFYYLKNLNIFPYLNSAYLQLVSKITKKSFFSFDIKRFEENFEQLN